MSRDHAPHPFRPPGDLQIDYARELNPQQLAAVTAPPGPSLVIAGAGSGKTRTLTYRVAYLLEQGIPADRILLLTFTNKAAREMMRRVGELIGGDLATLWGGTFHSIGHRILRRYADRLDYPANFTILDRDDASDLIAACMDEARIDVRAARFPRANVLADVFSLAVNTEKPPGRILDEQFDHLTPFTEQIEELQRRYTSRKRAAGVMDFDDLLELWWRLLREHRDICDQYQRRFQFILVDEYQDTNQLQADLIDCLAGRHHSVMVVGDDAQSIYSWRGASFQNILRFPERYPEVRTYRIETNYRSTPEILDVANAAIAANAHQFAKQLAPARKPGVKPIVVACGDANVQAEFIARRVIQLHDEGVPLKEMAVLYRAHFHALELQVELTRHSIPFTITSGIRFFEQAHIKDVAAYLKLNCNPRDELAFKRLAKLRPGIGDKSANKLWAAFSPEPPQGDSGDSDRRGLAAGLQRCAGGAPKKSATAWAQFTATMAQLDQPGMREDPAKMIRHVLEADYEDYLKSRYANYRSRRQDIEQLADYAQRFDRIEECLTQLALLSNLEAEEDKPASGDTEQIRLSTIHQAKGLEFAIVFVIMLCDGLFPSARSLEDDDSIEEERRLFYVAITRAKDELYLSHPLVRFAQGPGRDAVQSPSRFLQEIPGDIREEWNLGLVSPYG